MSRRRFDRRREVVSAGELIKSFLDGNQHGREARQHRVVTEWKQLVGERIAQRTAPGRFDQGVLWVRVSNSAWMHQLSFLKDELLEKINKGLGEPVIVRELRFHLGKQKREDREGLRAAEATQRRPTRRKRPLPRPASGDALDQICREAAHIEDEDLRAVVIEARRKLNT